MIDLEAAAWENSHPEGYPWEIHFQFPTKLLDLCPDVEATLGRHGIIITNLNNLDPDICYGQAFSFEYNFGVVKTLQCAFYCLDGSLAVTQYCYRGESSREYTELEDQIYLAFMLHLTNNVWCNWEDAITRVNALYPDQPRDKVRFVGERIRRQVAGIENEKQ